MIPYTYFLGKKAEIKKKNRIASNTYEAMNTENGHNQLISPWKKLQAKD